MSSRYRPLSDNQRVSVYSKQWDRFYVALAREGQGKALWDVDPEFAVAKDYTEFSTYLDKDLPIVDFGCGTGRQTTWLGGVYSRAIGIDVSQKAIEQATQWYQREHVDFLVVDQSNPGFYAGLSADLGDMNIYVRGVLHQIMAEHQSVVIDSLKAMMGVHGRLYMIEVAQNIRDYLTCESAQFASLPEPMKRTLISRLPPRGLSVDAFETLLPNDSFRILASGESFLNTNITFDNGKSVHIPAVYCIVETLELR